MAEAAVAQVIVKVVEIAANLLSSQASREYDYQENINWIETHMRHLQSYLKDAVSKNNGSHEVAALIISIQDLANDVEDILDTYLPEIQSHNNRGKFHFLKHMSCMLCYGVKTNKFALEIEKIKKRAAELEVCRTNCGIVVRSDAGPSYDATCWDRRNLFLHAAPESNIFGRKETLKELEEALVHKSNRCRIVSVVGPGGVGKTTVTKRIYHKVKGHFKRAAMSYVSKEPKVGELLLDIAKQVGLIKYERMENLEKNLYSFLQRKRYIIFLDDVWDTKIWDHLRNIIPTSSENGSRIIVTTRSADVGRYIGGESSLIPLNILREKEGRDLFFHLISEEPLPPILKDIGEKIVVRCSGLPLALVVAVGMLKSKERSKHAWNEVLSSMSEGDENDDCLKILALSYQDLPAELKPFFLYFGVFPEGREIFVSELTRLWLVEKLIQVDGFRNVESVVEANINKLVSRNLIQVCRRRSDGRARSCRIHDLLHKLCIQMAEGTNFFCTHNKLQSFEFAPIVRRVTTNSWSSSERAFEGFRVPPKLRSLLCFNEGKQVLNFMKRNALNLRFLRLLTLEVEGTKSHVPDEITKLTRLKYLKLKGEFIVLPSSISRLKKLETLDVRSGAIVPCSILEMNHLKHLFLVDVSIDESTCNSGHKGVEAALENLETLHFRLDNRLGIEPGSIRKMSNLRKLCISNYPDYEMEKVLDTSTPLEKLEALKLGLQCLTVTNIEWLNLSRYQYLVKLHLYMHTMISGSPAFPPNLIKITLESIYILRELMEPLKKLHKLEIIKLKNCRTTDPLDFAGGNNYRQLQVLVLWDTNFRELVVDEKGLPKLDTIIYQPYPFPPAPIIPQRLRKMMVTMDDY